MTPRSVYQAVSKSVVTVVVLDDKSDQIATGSGVVLSADGRIVTNYHVVEGGVSFEIHFAAGMGISEPVRGSPSACAASTDLALLTVPAPYPLPYARKAATVPAVGERVVAIGSPFQLEGSLSDGVISQIRVLKGRTLLQTTAPISPGSSGGGLFLHSGELVGITTLSFKGGQGLNFAVPVSAFSSLRPCSTFPGNVSDRPSPTSTETPPDCKSGLSMERFHASDLGFSGGTRLTGVIANRGCGTADGVRLRVEVSEKDSGKYVYSRTIVLSRDPLARGDSLDFDEPLVLPVGRGVSLTLNYQVRDLRSPF